MAGGLSMGTTRLGRQSPQGAVRLLEPDPSTACCCVPGRQSPMLHVPEARTVVAATAMHHWAARTASRQGWDQPCLLGEGQFELLRVSP